MKILLISPTIDGKKKTNKGLMMPQLALYILKGLTPEVHAVKLVEEEVEAVDLNADCDLVGISCMTANAPRAYALARDFKNRGKTVILGGVHPTILPDEAAQHGDSVVIGEAEGVWEALLTDFENGSLKPRYHEPNPDLTRYIPKDFGALIKRRLFNIVPIVTTRGCPYNCDFCCVTDLFGRKIRHIPVENVIREIKASPFKQFMFLDDNIMGHPKYAKALFKAMIPLRVKWAGQASLSFVKDEELMRLAAQSGCKALFLGLESVSEVQIKHLRKSLKELDYLEKAIKMIHGLGILINASMIFGFDSDTPEVFDETVRFLIKNKIGTVSFNVLTPYPGTKTYQDLKSQGRLLTEDWKYYDHNTVVFRPKNMTPYELQRGKIQAKKNFFRMTSVLRRLTGNLFFPSLYFALNMGHRKQSRVEKRNLSGLSKELFEV